MSLFSFNNFVYVTVIELPKKNQAKKFSEHRTINLISHTGKIVVRILSKRSDSKIEEEQFRFRKGNGTRDLIGLMRVISERKRWVCPS